MAAHTNSDESAVRDFAAACPTPNVLWALDLCERGVLTWGEVVPLLAKALAAGIAAVSE